MIKSSIIAAALICQCQGTPRGIEQVGTSAAGADAVIAAFTDRYGEIDGRIEWRDGVFECGGILVHGCQIPNGCSLSILVERIEPAWQSALAHEMCHYVIGADEHSTGVCAAEINAAAEASAIGG